MRTEKYFMIAFACAFMNVIDVHAENRMLEITSQTENPSADCIIKKLNKKKDKARKEIGIGEIVTLTLTRKEGKPLNKNTKVTWTKKGKGATLNDRYIYRKKRIKRLDTSKRYVFQFEYK